MERLSSRLYVDGWDGWLSHVVGSLKAPSVLIKLFLLFDLVRAVILIKNYEDDEKEDNDDNRCSLKICCPVDLNETPRWVRREAGERAAVPSWDCVDHRHHCNDDDD